MFDVSIIEKYRSWEKSKNPCLHGTCNFSTQCLAGTSLVFHDHFTCFHVNFEVPFDLEIALTCRADKRAKVAMKANFVTLQCACTSKGFVTQIAFPSPFLEVDQSYMLLHMNDPFGAEGTPLEQ